MTVVQAIKKALENNHSGMTASEIHEEIVRRNLYNFLAMQPISIVNSTLRRHCQGIDFPTASPVKHFNLAGKKRGKNIYNLINDNILPSNIVISKEKDEKMSELLPEEIISSTYRKHCENVKLQLLEKILNNNPAFFERLVLKLLLAMGYGYSAESGIITGGSYDKGIDGIIDEDRLGFSKVYIQAKRYSRDNIVRSNELQNFVGSSLMEEKGVFITTSFFHKNATKYAQEVERKGVKLKLIDGPQLVDLMLRYKIGVTIADTINTYIVDSEYFSE